MSSQATEIVILGPVNKGTASQLAEKLVRAVGRGFIPGINPIKSTRASAPPSAAGLSEKRERLAAVRATLAEREADIAQMRSQLKAFEGRYLQRVGVFYTKLDEIAVRITEREVDLYDSDSARRRAQQARQRAQETHEAAFGAGQEPEEFDPSPSLKTLFREVAKRKCRDNRAFPGLL